MIPIWLLTVLHYVSVTVAAVMLGVLGWHYLGPNSREE